MDSWHSLNIDILKNLKLIHTVRLSAVETYLKSMSQRPFDCAQGDNNYCL